MSSQCIRETVVRRVRLREELKPVGPYWYSTPTQPDWVFITKVSGPGAAEFFELQLIKIWAGRGAGMIGQISHDTLASAKGEAHADLGIEYVEWEPCCVEITDQDGSIEWDRALPPARAA